VATTPDSLYDEDDLLPLSGLAHMAFCERRWALVHVEQQWAENRYTVEGEQGHERAHSGIPESRPDLLIRRTLASPRPLRAKRCRGISSIHAAERNFPRRARRPMAAGSGGVQAQPRQGRQHRLPPSALRTGHVPGRNAFNLGHRRCHLRREYAPA